MESGIDNASAAITNEGIEVATFDHDPNGNIVEATSPPLSQPPCAGSRERRFRRFCARFIQQPISKQQLGRSSFLIANHANLTNQKFYNSCD